MLTSPPFDPDAGGLCTAPTRVLVADDQGRVRSEIRATLEHEEDIEVVGEAEDGHSAVILARRRAANLVVMGVRTPALDGLKATRMLAGPDVEDPIDVIVATTNDLDDYVLEALRAGASGLLLKDSVPDELVPAIRAVGRGHGLIDAALTRRLISEYTSFAPRYDTTLGWPSSPRVRIKFSSSSPGVTATPKSARRW